MQHSNQMKFKKVIGTSPSFINLICYLKQDFLCSCICAAEWPQRKKEGIQRILEKKESYFSGSRVWGMVNGCSLYENDKACHLHLSIKGFNAGNDIFTTSTVKLDLKKLRHLQAGMHAWYRYPLGG